MRKYVIIRMNNYLGETPLGGLVITEVEKIRTRLLKEFEQKLDRTLTKKEYEFIDWMVRQQVSES
ncbi:hypothetical protein SAMN05216238_11338 [Lentibacillus persicus]|uniref:Uncharacterized protein n=2 Tax=Lentibacillus persicus TaxID=640948 RepID=A0A1I1ZR31_9BACI|nr:hypothetical protein SAMN05216238_11338 [Lentibacillus persicus]